MSIAENLVNNQSCAESFNFERFKAIKSFKKYLDLSKMEAIYVLNKKQHIY